MNRWPVVLMVVAAGVLPVAAQAPEPALAEVVARVTAYVEAYEQQFSALVAEERYVQELTGGTVSIGGGGNLSQSNPGGGMATSSSSRTRRVLKSDYLIARLEDGGWMPFRDVYDVDGRRVADRTDRLATLFLRPGATAVDQAMQIMLDSTRHNLGSTTRSISIPILGLMLLHSDVRDRMAVTRERLEVVAGRSCWVLGITETVRPALVKTIGGDLPLTASLAVDPMSGLVLWTRLSVEDDSVKATVTTTYRDEPKVGFWVPARMDDDYVTRGGAERVTGVATYERFRRFNVATDEAIRKPPPR